jgi:predicted permease
MGILKRKLRAAWMRIGGVVHAGRLGDDFAAELESHVAMHTEDGIRAGLSADEARRQALIKLGGAEQTRQAYSEQSTVPWMENFLRDVRFALRGFRRNPVFTITAIATLALGIGATTAVFSVVDRILFRSLPYAHDDRIVSVGLVQSLERQEFTLGGFFFEWQQEQRPFQSMTFERGVDECNLTEANPVRLQCGRVAGNFLTTLGVSPLLGRNFLPAEDEPNGPKAAMISAGLWLSRYNRDPGVLNRTIDLDGKAVRIIGVLPKNFEMPRLQQVDVLLPAQTDVTAQHRVNAGIGYPMWAFARLKPGVSIAVAKAEMEPLFRHTQAWIPGEFRQDFHLEVRSLRDRQMQSAYTAAWVLLGAVFAVLLIACANVASLLSARGAARERELAVRSVLGASRGRLVGQALVEIILLAAAGAGTGCILAEVLLRIFVAIAPTGIPFIASARLDLRIVLFTVCAALACAVLFGMIPALSKPRTGALTARAAARGAQARLRRTLVVMQIAVSVVLLSGASLLLKSFRNMERQNLGMQTRNVLTLQIPLVAARYQTGAAYMNFYLRTEAALRGLPGVTAVGISDSLPPDANSWHDGRRYADIFVVGKPRIPVGTGGTLVRRTVTPDYFRALQIPIVQGRGFTEQERSSSGDFIILSNMLAARLFPGGDAIGQHIQFADYNPRFALNGPVFTVVGVAGNVKNAGLASEDEPEYYELRTDHNPESWNQHCLFELETELPASVLAPWVRARVSKLDPTAPVELEALSRSVSKLADRPRFEAALLGFFAACGLLMAVIGLYGVISFIAAQRTREIGVRMALGASRIDILRLITGEGLRLIALGAALGLAAALSLSRLLKSLLFHISPNDPATFASVTLLLALIALAATLIPARAAMRADPMESLRAE